MACGDPERLSLLKIFHWGKEETSPVLAVLSDVTELRRQRGSDCRPAETGALLNGIFIFGVTSAPLAGTAAGTAVLVSQALTR